MLLCKTLQWKDFQYLEGFINLLSFGKVYFFKTHKISPVVYIHKCETFMIATGIYRFGWLLIFVVICGNPRATNLKSISRQCDVARGLADAVSSAICCCHSSPEKCSEHETFAQVTVLQKNCLQCKNVTKMQHLHTICDKKHHRAEWRAGSHVWSWDSFHDSLKCWTKYLYLYL